MVYIYGLKCPHSGAVRYIGKSNNPSKRLRAHIYGAMRHVYNHHAARWIRKLQESGLRPELRILELVPAGKDWRAAERDWIKRALDLGWPLTNSTAGGEGLDYLNPSDELAFRQNHRKAMRRFAQTSRGKAAFAKMNAASRSPEVRQRAAETLRETYKSPEVKDRLRRSMEIARSSPGFKESKSRGSKKAWIGHRETIMAAFGSLRWVATDAHLSCWNHRSF